MRIRTVLSGKDTHKLRDKISKLATSVESEDWDSGQLNMVCMRYSSIGHPASQTGLCIAKFRGEAKLASEDRVPSLYSYVC